MSELISDLTQYTSLHRTRESRENGSVKLVGKRQKKWEGTYHVWDESGVRHTRRRIVGTKAEIPTKGEALDQHRAWIRRQAQQPVATKGQATVNNLCDDFVQLRKSGWEDATQSSNAAILNQGIRPVIGHLAIAKVGAEDLKRLVDNLPERVWTTPRGEKHQGVSYSYARKVITLLRGIFDLAEARKLITANPSRSAVFRLKTPLQAREPEHPVFPPRYLAALLNELSPRDQLIVRISLLGATRPNELFALTGGDVGPGWAYVERSLDKKRRPKRTKTKSSKRFVHIPPELDRDLHAWIAAQGTGPTDPVFPNRDGRFINRQKFLDYRLRPAAKRAKIPVADVNFQMLRRSFATLAQLLDLDVKAVQQQMGHARARMTVDTYMQAIDARTAEQMGFLEDMLAGRKPIPLDVEARLERLVIQ